MAETSAMTDFDLMSPFISLIPLSEDAAHAMKCSTNHSILYHNPDPEENGHPYIACFPLFDLYGKTHLTFGTSRAAHFTVPHMPDIASFHFTIHFDLSSFRLLLTQRAAPELVCQRPENGSRIPPTQHQIQLPRSAEVIFGEAGRFRFLLHVNHSVWQKTSAFKKAFREYQKSLRVSVCSTPIRKKRRGSSLDLEVPQKIKQPRFDPINAEITRWKDRCQYIEAALSQARHQIKLKAQEVKSKALELLAERDKLAWSEFVIGVYDCALSNGSN